MTKSVFISSLFFITLIHTLIQHKNIYERKIRNEYIYIESQLSRLWVSPLQFKFNELTLLMPSFEWISTFKKSSIVFKCPNFTTPPADRNVLLKISVGSFSKTCKFFPSLGKSKTKEKWKQAFFLQSCNCFYFPLFVYWFFACKTECPI